MNLENELDEILRAENLRIVFQPIVTLTTTRLLGHEALMRSPSSCRPSSPADLIRAAREGNRLIELESLALRRATAEFARQKVGGRLFLNLSPRGLTSLYERRTLTREHLRGIGLVPNQIVIELTEQAPIVDYDSMRETLRYFRQLGVSFALDDVGAGYSGLRHLNELHPEYVKIDRHFVAELGHDSRKRGLVELFHGAAHRLNCTVIAEGVETLEELATLRELGIEHAQGFLLALPESQCRNGVEMKDLGGDIQRGAAPDSAGSIMRAVEPVPERMPAVETADRFDRDNSVCALPLVDDQRRPVGVITRNGLQGRLSLAYGRALSQRKAVAAFADAPLVVPLNQTLESLSRRITESPHLVGDEIFVVVDDNGQYAGIGTVIDLLRRMTDLRVEAARHSNPLSGLPGNVPIDRAVTSYIRDGVDFVLAHFDIDEFKSYNDRYGYAAGDDLLRFLADAVRWGVDSDLDFAGHVGGDDFVVVFRSDDWEARCRQILDTFARNAPAFYDQADRDRGGLLGRTRRGQEVFHPLVSLSIGAVPAPAGRFAVHHELAHVASEVKTVAKKLPGCSLQVDRRGTRREADDRVAGRAG